LFHFGTKQDSAICQNTAMKEFPNRRRVETNPFELCNGLHARTDESCEHS
jgi:hypothetical protein